MSRAAEWARTSATDRVENVITIHYCLYNDESTQKVMNVLSSLVAQLAQHRPSILATLHPKPTKDRLAQLKQLETCIVSAASMSQFVLFVDALHESTDRSEIHRSLARVAADCANGGIVVSSTPGVSDFLDNNTACVQVAMAADLSENDMTVLIDQRIKDSKLLQSLPSSDIRDALLEKANGSFRWPELQMQYIITQPTPKRAMQAIESTSSTLDAAYAAVLSRVPSESLAFAARPLTLRELSEAIVIEDDQEDIDDTFRLVPQDLLLTLCHGLLGCDAFTTQVRFAHVSVLTYLVGDTSERSDNAYWHLDPSECSRGILRKCFTYLATKPFQRRPILRDEKEHLEDAYPLLCFASTHWILHVQATGTLTAGDLESARKILKKHRSPRTGGYVGPFGHSVWVDHNSVTSVTDVYLEFGLDDGDDSSDIVVAATWFSVLPFEWRVPEMMNTTDGLCQVLNLAISEIYSNRKPSRTCGGASQGCTTPDVLHTSMNPIITGIGPTAWDPYVLPPLRLSPTEADLYDSPATLMSEFYMW
ncbi:hypothetical protein LTR95_017961 [Oleoguttula sp. CCFEE 5521]